MEEQPYLLNLLLFSLINQHVGEVASLRVPQALAQNHTQPNEILGRKEKISLCQSWVWFSSPLHSSCFPLFLFSICILMPHPAQYCDHEMHLLFASRMKSPFICKGQSSWKLNFKQRFLGRDKGVLLSCKAIERKGNEQDGSEGKAELPHS